MKTKDNDCICAWSNGTSIQVNGLCPRHGYNATRVVAGPTLKPTETVVTMPLRDWFAGQALSGEVAVNGLGGSDVKDVAAWCYEMADAMLKAREIKSSSANAQGELPRPNQTTNKQKG